MARHTNKKWKILAFSLSLLLFSGCDLTLGPKVETRYVIVKPGVPVVVLENETLRCRVLTDTEGDMVRQDLGGWIAMPPEHWEAVKQEIERLRK